MVGSKSCFMLAAGCDFTGASLSLNLIMSASVVRHTGLVWSAAVVVVSPSRTRLHRELYSRQRGPIFWTERSG